MPTDIKRVLDEALKLDAGVRVLVAGTLLEGLDLDDAVDASDAWRDAMVADARGARQRRDRPR